MSNKWQEDEGTYQKVFKSMWDQTSNWKAEEEEEKAAIANEIEKTKKEAEKLKKEAEKARQKYEQEKLKREKEAQTEFNFQLKKLSLKEGDIVIVHLSCAPKPGLTELVHQLMDMKPIKNLKIPVLIIPHEIEIGAMNEAEMNKAGWYKRGHRLVRPIT